MDKLNLVSRDVHFSSSGILFGTILFNYLYNSNEFLEDDPYFFAYILPLTGTLSFLTGLISHHLLKPK